MRAVGQLDLAVHAERPGGVREAASSAEDRDLTIAPEEFVVESNGTVRVTLRGDAHTVVLRRIPRLRPWTVVRAEGSARTEAGG